MTKYACVSNWVSVVHEVVRLVLCRGGGCVRLTLLLLPSRKGGGSALRVGCQCRLGQAQYLSTFQAQIPPLSAPFTEYLSVSFVPVFLPSLSSWGRVPWHTKPGENPRTQTTPAAAGHETAERAAARGLQRLHAGHDGSPHAQPCVCKRRRQDQRELPIHVVPLQG